MLSRELARRFPLLYALATRHRVWLFGGVALLFAATAYGRYIELILHSTGLVTKLGPMIGGDFLVFRTAGVVAGTPEIVRIYDMNYLSTVLQREFPGQGLKNFGWFYPPTMYLVVAPLARLPFTVGFVIWETAFAGLLSVSLYAVWRDRRALAFAMLSPVVLLAVMTGQTGMLTGSLLASGAYFADRRPIVAGVAIGLLTVKPQFGLLIPLAFLASRSWRAIAIASATSLAMAAISVVAYGMAPWRAFVDAMRTHGMRMQGSGFPLNKLITPFGGLRAMGMSSDVAVWVQAACTVLLAAYVILVWARVKNSALRVIALATAAPLATPYAFYYELVILVIPMVLLARYAETHGWLKAELASLVLLWLVSFAPPGTDQLPAFPVSFAVAAMAFLVGARRVVPAAFQATRNTGRVVGDLRDDFHTAIPMTSLGT